MDREELSKLLNSVASGGVSPDDALNKIRTQPYKDLGFAKIDTQRGVRKGAAEVIYAQGKTAEQVLSASLSILESGEKSVLITRLDSDSADFVGKNVSLYYDSVSHIGIAGEKPENIRRGKIVVATGGTSDIPVAEEAAQTAEFYSNNVLRLYDVGVAGIHRLFDNIDDFSGANVIIAVAGMEGALASVIGGFADCPVIAVPTSVGYGANFGGLSALLSMLNSCASGVSVVNIDNGFGAGYIANMINRR